MESVVVSHIKSTDPRYAQVWELREEILRIPLGLSLKNEDLSRDHNDDIFIAENEGKVVGCLLMHHLDGSQTQLRAMAVKANLQGKGIGRLIVQAAEQFSLAIGYDKIVLHARKVAVGFYKSLDYTTFGDEFTEVGIPHMMMEKLLVK